MAFFFLKKKTNYGAAMHLSYTTSLGDSHTHCCLRRHERQQKPSPGGGYSGSTVVSLPSNEQNSLKRGEAKAAGPPNKSMTMRPMVDAVQPVKPYIHDATYLFCFFFNKKQMFKWGELESRQREKER
jgi:hypothetical protein